MDPIEGGETGTRAGMIALVGRPNAGKSTLLNAFVGQKLSIVTPKAQTTWRRVAGIATSARAQAVFVDTPGLLEARDLLHRSMLHEAAEALRDADVVLVVLDAARGREESRDSLLQAALRDTAAPRFAAVNKADIASAADLESLSTWAEEELGSRPFTVSAAQGTGVQALLQAIEEALPLSPFLYDPDDVAYQPVRFFVAELLRETIFEQFSQEVPYSVFCRVDEFRESQDPVYIRAELVVERNSQKQILIGQQGRAIRQLGREARQKVEHLIGRPVYLDLWVKAIPGWRRKRGHLSRFGFSVPEDDARTT